MTATQPRDPGSAFEHESAEPRLLASLSVAKVGVWILDADGRTTFANDPLANMLGTTREATLGRHVGELLDGEEARIANILLNGPADEHPDQHELQLPGPGEDGIWALMSVTPLQASDGAFDGSLAILTDITKRKRGELELRQRAAIVDFSSDAILSKDRDCKVTEWNRGAERMYGYSAAEIIGRPASILQPADRRVAERAIVDRVLGGEVIDPYETQRLAKDGSLVEVSLAVSAIRDASGAIIAASSTARDITEQIRVIEELRESEELFRGGFEHSPIGMALESPDGSVVKVNTAFAQMLGYDEPDELKGVTLASITHPDDVARDSHQRRVILVEGRPYTTEKRYIRRSGQTVQVTTASTIVEDSHGTPTAFFTQVEDVTERRRDEQRMQQRTSELQAANQELEAFAHSLAHDLRAPLRAIDGFGATLSRRYGVALEDPGRSMLARMRAASTRMGEVIDAMLLLSELTRRELSPARIDLSAMAREISDELRLRDRSRQVDFVIEDRLQTVSDPRLVRVLLVNLLENAWKFTASCEHARIEIASAGAGIFAVRDNGAGFDMASAELLFKPFSRLHREDEFPGTGIGLTTVQRIVRRHGGAVWGEGHPGAGATFYFKLDRQEETKS
jgi:PAS domain S-box-containing protein